MSSAQNPQYLEFITHLRKARQAKKMTQEQLAQRLNQVQTFISKVETCERRLDVIEAAEWCAALGISIDSALPIDLKSQTVVRKEDSSA